MKRYIPLLLLLFLTGCSGNVKVSGKVQFSDGSPLTSGIVTFDDGKNNFSGKVQPDGSFSIGQLRDGQGIPKGKYKAVIGDAFIETIVDENKPPVIEYLVDNKYSSPSTSGFEFDITGKKTDIVLTVEKPPGKKK